MKKILFLIIACTLTLCWYSCQKLENAYIDPNAPAPAPVTNLGVKNTPGGAVVSYQIPKDPNLLYVKAVYEIQSGVYRVAKSSYYVDTLPLVGFGDTLSHEVKIYSVGRNEKESEPLTVQVKPLTPPVKSVFAATTLDEAFGGVTVTFQNPLQAELAIHVIMDTTGQNTWTTVTTYYTAAVEGEFSARGLDTIQRKFGVYITDRWDNTSDTLEKSLTPLYEMEIPKKGFQLVTLPGDHWQPINPTSVATNLWNGIINTPADNDLFNYADQNSPLPKWITVDLGMKVRFSRMKFWQWQPPNRLYLAYQIKRWEIWGSNAPDPDGGWNNWELLGSFTDSPPSGMPITQYTPEDRDYEVAGGDYPFAQPVPAVRYIRFKNLENQGASTLTFAFGEFSFFGQPQP